MTTSRRGPDRKTPTAQAFFASIQLWGSIASDRQFVLACNAYWEHLQASGATGWSVSKICPGIWIATIQWESPAHRAFTRSRLRVSGENPVLMQSIAHELSGVVLIDSVEEAIRWGIDKSPACEAALRDRADRASSLSANALAQLDRSLARLDWPIS